MKRINWLLLVMGILAITAVSSHLWKYSHKPPLDNVYIEADKNFTYKSLPIHPLLIYMLNTDYLGNDSIEECTIDLDILDKDNIYKKYEFEINKGRVISTFPNPYKTDVKSGYMYEHIGITDDGLHILIGCDLYKERVFFSVLLVGFDLVEELNNLNECHNKVMMSLKDVHFLGYIEYEEDTMENRNGYNEIDVSEEPSIRI